MKLLLLLSVWNLAGCASTAIYENGQLVFKTQADAVNIEFRTNNTYFRADVLTHSTPTIAGGKAATRVISGVSGLVGAGGAALAGARL